MENSALKVAIIQLDLIWEDVYANRLLIHNKINTIDDDDVDIIILPEMFTTGFTMNAAQVAETMEGKTLDWLKIVSNKRDVVFIGSLIISEGKKYYNRLVCVQPRGIVTYYDKRHTFTLAGEHKTYKSGNEKIIFEYKGWKICPLVCYDLRFPVWSRNTEDYDVLIYVANWPQPRIEAWDTLLKARAIENMSYCIGVNRVGEDDNGHKYPGHSAAYDVLGNRLDNIPENAEAAAVVVLDKNHIKTNREKLGFLNDKDQFSLVK